MKYLALGIVQKNWQESSQIAFVSFQEWKLLYYIPQNVTLSVQEQAKIYFQEIQKIFETATILPFRFGSFLESEAEMILLLKENKEHILEEWGRLQNTSEVRLTFEAGAIPKELPEKLISDKPGISFWQNKYQQNAKVQYFQSILNEKDSSKMIIDSRNQTQDKTLTFDFLIQKNKVEAFYQLLAEVLSNLKVTRHEVSKPTAPFRFVNLTLKNE